MFIAILEFLKIYLLPFIFGMVPLTIWLFFFLLRDWKHPEPRKVVFLAFIMGILSSFIVLVIQNYIEYFAKIKIPNLYEALRYHDTFKDFLFVAFLEEITKFSVIYFTFRKSKYLDEAIDPMIYMIVCAIGFSSIENYFSIFQQWTTLSIPIQTLIARFLGANLLHIICSGVIGFFWSMQIFTKKYKLLFIGIILAVLFHTIFNTLIFTYGIFAILLMFICVFIGASILLWLFDVVEKLNLKIKF